MLSNEEKNKIITTLQGKIPDLTCPMCKTRKFVIADAYFNNTLQQNLASISLGGSSIPTIPIVCENCGFVSQHALGILNLLPKEAKPDTDEPK